MENEKHPLDDLKNAEITKKRCQQNPARGKAFLEKSQDSPYKNYGLGMMYAEGLGVREDIEQGVVYLKRAAWANYEPAKEALTHYKKSWFGVWRRK